MTTTERVVIGMDPHKRSVTIEVMTADETVLGGGRLSTDVEGFQAMAEYVRRWPDRVWAIEGCNGIGQACRAAAPGRRPGGRRRAAEALSTVHARVFSTGQARKSDATDAHSVALVGIPRGCWRGSGSSGCCCRRWSRSSGWTWPGRSSSSSRERASFVTAAYRVAVAAPGDRLLPADRDLMLRTFLRALGVDVEFVAGEVTS